MQILRQATIAHLLEAEHALDDPNAVLNLRAHSGLMAVLRLDRLIDSLSPSVAPVDAVASPRSDGVDNVAVALVGLISPDAGLLSAHTVVSSGLLLGQG